MTTGKTNPKTQPKVEAKKVEQTDEYVTNAIIKPMNIYDREAGKYTDEINQKVVKVETFVDDLKTQKPETIGYINIRTLIKFIDGEVKAVPIKIRRSN